MKSLIADFALLSISLIHVLLHGSQTTRASQSSLPEDQSATISPWSFLFVKRFFPGNNSFIQLLQRCSADSLAVSGQKAHSFCIQHYLTLFPVPSASLRGLLMCLLPISGLSFH